MNKKTLEALVASPPEREELVIQLFKVDSGQWGEIFQENGRYNLELYPKPDGEPWVLDLEEVVKVLNLAWKELDKRLKE